MASSSGLDAQNSPPNGSSPQGAPPAPPAVPWPGCAWCLPCLTYLAIDPNGTECFKEYEARGARPCFGCFVRAQVHLCRPVPAQFFPEANALLEVYALYRMRRGTLYERLLREMANAFNIALGTTTGQGESQDQDQGQSQSQSQSRPRYFVEYTLSEMLQHVLDEMRRININTFAVGQLLRAQFGIPNFYGSSAQANGQPQQTQANGQPQQMQANGQPQHAEANGQPQQPEVNGQTQQPEVNGGSQQTQS